MHRSLRIWTLALVATLCAAHFWMASSVSRTFGTTFDEIAHLTAGYGYWTTGDYRLQPENGNLPQRWAALPLLGMNLRFPSKDSQTWASADIWGLGHDFFYKLGNDPAAILAAGRAMIAILSALTCLLIFLWARELFGRNAAFVALTLAAFAPEMLAHGGLATSDAAATLGFVAAIYSWSRLLRRATPSRILAAGFCAGFLAVSKHSVVLFAPIAVLMAAVRLVRPSPVAFVFGQRPFLVRGWHRVPAAAALLLSCAVICITIIWGSFGFRYRAPEARSDRDNFNIPWSEVLLEHATLPTFGQKDGIVDMRPGVVQHFVSFARTHHLLPEAWLYGLAFVEKHSRARLAFFCGEYRTTGWPEFFPVAFALKTTIPALLLAGAGLAYVSTAPRRRRAALLYRVSPLLILLAVYWGFSLQSKLNIGHRHLLPVYPACYILAGASVCWVAGRRRLPIGVALASLLGWHVVASVAARPDYLAYFNPLAGEPTEVNRLLVDSSLDWGQDLPRLREWIDTHAANEKVFLSYFGSDSPVHHGIHAVRVSDGYFDTEPRRTPPPLTGGVYCISATMFRRVYTHVRGPWSLAYEDSYQKLGTWATKAAARPAGSPITDVDGSPMEESTIRKRLRDYEQLLFGRLCHFLENRTPDAHIGGSFLIWKLNDAEVGFALSAPLPVLERRLLELRAESTR